MNDLGNFMKKRTRDLMIGAGLLGVGTFGAIAALSEKDYSQQKVVHTTGVGVISSNTKTVHIQGQPTHTPPPQQGTQYITPPPQPQPQPSHHHSSLCAEEALRVGIKHFRYADASPNELVWSGYGNKNDAKYKIHRNAQKALKEMVDDARADGVTLTAGSIFRGASRQAQIVNAKKAKGQSLKQIYHTSSHPGHSEHHTGLAVDFAPIDHSFAKTKGYRWLKQNAHKYGFYQSFTPEYSKYSGISEESWHWRYEGKNGEYAHVFEASKNRRC